MINKRFRLLVLLALVLAFGHDLSAQRTVQGTVSDAATGEAIIGAAVRVKEHTAIGSVTDQKGHYFLQLPDSKACHIEVSFLGYHTKNQQIKSGSSMTLDVALSENVSMLETVVVTGTRTPKLLKDVPVITRVIDAKEILATDVGNVQDLLQAELPGIEFTYSMNQQVSLNMQGFGGNSVLFLVDGERMAGETLDNVDYSRLGLNDVGRIEIVKGAASSLYGSNAVGGVVNLISREAKEPWTLNVGSRWGSHNDWRNCASLSFNTGRFSSTTNFQHTSCDPIAMKNDGDFGTIYGNHTFSLKEKITVSPTHRMKLTARAGYFFRERESLETAHDRYRDFSGGLKAEYDLDESSDLTLSYAFDQYDKSSYALQSGLDVRSYSNVQHNLRGLFNHGFGKKSTLTLGGDYMRDYLMSYQFSDNGAHIQHTADAFAQFDWSATEKLSVIAALRYDFFSQAKLHHVSPKLGMMYKLGKVALRASYADGFRAPTLKEMYMSFDMANIFMIYGNPNLRPETSHNFNLAAEYTRNHYNVTLLGFHNRVSDRITTVWNQALNGMKYENMSPLTISGLDFSASARWDCGLRVRLSYIFTHESLNDSDLHTSTTRPHSATARVEYGKNWKNYGFNVALTGRALSAVTCDEYTSLTDLTETERVTYPGYTIWKLFVLQHIGRGLNLTATVDNLFNYIPEYYYSNSPATTGTTFAVGLSVDIDKYFKDKTL